MLTEGAARIAACSGNPDHYDVQTAGWWLWGACAWIGSGWCAGDGPWSWDSSDWINDPAAKGIRQKLPHLGDAGRGINRQLPHLGDAGQERSAFIRQWLETLSARLRHVRVACGDWSRVCGNSVTWRHGLTGVFMDPPYGVEDRTSVYTNDCRNVAALAREWAITAGRRSDMRIAFAGYEGEHEFPESWSSFRWKAAGGYGSQGDDQGRANAKRETLWFSPACVSPAQADMFVQPAPDLSAAYDRAALNLFAEPAP